MNRPSLLLIASAIAASAMPAFAAAPAQKCPAKDFKGFLAAFIESTAVQRAHVAVPLSSSYVDGEAQPEPAIVKRQLQADAIEYPVMPNKAQLAKDRLVMSTKSISVGDTEVKVALPDTGYQFRYLFRKTGKCWTLVEINDDSV